MSVQNIVYHEPESDSIICDLSARNSATIARLPRVLSVPSGGVNGDLACTSRPNGFWAGSWHTIAGTDDIPETPITPYALMFASYPQVIPQSVDSPVYGMQLDHAYKVDYDGNSLITQVDGFYSVTSQMTLQGMTSYSGSPCTFYMYTNAGGNYISNSGWRNGYSRTYDDYSTLTTTCIKYIPAGYYLNLYTSWYPSFSGPDIYVYGADYNNDIELGYNTFVVINYVSPYNGFKRSMSTYGTPLIGQDGAEIFSDQDEIELNRLIQLESRMQEGVEAFELRKKVLIMMTRRNNAIRDKEMFLERMKDPSNRRVKEPPLVCCSGGGDLEEECVEECVGDIDQEPYELYEGGLDYNGVVSDADSGVTALTSQTASTYKKKTMVTTRTVLSYEERLVNGERMICEVKTVIEDCIDCADCASDGGGDIDDDIGDIEIIDK